MKLNRLQTKRGSDKSPAVMGKGNRKLRQQGRKEKRGMEETFAGLVSEVEKAVRLLGFRIEAADRCKHTPVFTGQEKADDGELRITIVREGKVG